MAMRRPASCSAIIASTVYHLVDGPGDPIARTAPTPTADRILVAAMDAFGTRGYDGTSLDDLARELGIRKQTILYWYPSKEALLEAVVDRCAEEVAAAWCRR